MPLKIQIISRFWKEKSVEDMDEFTLGPTAQGHTNIFKNVKLKKNGPNNKIQGKKNCSITLVPNALRASPPMLSM